MPPRRRGGARPMFRDNNKSEQERQAIYQPREQYPPIDIPRLVPARSSEAGPVAQFRRYRKAMQDGPYFAVLDPTARVVKPGVLSGTWSLAYRLDAGKVGNGFDAFPTFSAKYKKIRRPMPKLEGRVYVKELFPAELHKFIDPQSDEASKAQRRRKRVKGAKGQDDAEVEEDEFFSDEDLDDVYEESDDDNNDYNAEGYFDNGEGDDDDDDGGGDQYD